MRQFILAGQRPQSPRRSGLHRNPDDTLLDGDFIIQARLSLGETFRHERDDPANPSRRIDHRLINLESHSASLKHIWPHRYKPTALIATIASPLAVTAWAITAPTAKSAVTAGKAAVTLLARFRHTHIQRAVIHRERIEHADGLLRFILRAHRHEGKAFRLA